jgi:hypothetical protein
VGREQSKVIIVEAEKRYAMRCCDFGRCVGIRRIFDMQRECTRTPKDIFLRAAKRTVAGTTNLST